jgi:S-(hydroxymethyl)glutathione dehydrogenase/alcohol dehydrogenase
MKAAVLHEAGRPLSVETLELDGPRAGEVRVRVTASGLCHSDYHMVTGDLPTTLPAVLGHEAAGVVEAVGEDVQGLKPGDTVVTCVSAYCGQCHECQTGHTHRCDDKPKGPARDAGSRLTLNGRPIYQLGGLGGFAEEMVVHQRAVAKIPNEVPAASAALLGCGVLTGVGAVLNGVKMEPGSTVAVIGCGGVGLNVIQGARIAGASEIIAIDLNPAKLELARRFGATATVQGGADSVGAVVEMTKGGVDYAFEVIGLPSTMRDAFLMLRKGGTAMLMGVAKMGAELTIPIAPFVFKEVRVMSSMMGSSPFQLFLPKLAEYYLDGRLKLDELVSKRIPLSDINGGFDSMAGGEVARSVIVF